MLIILILLFGIICLENNISSGVKNGTIGIIKKIDNKILYFKSNDKIFKIDFVKYNKFDYGYSVTIHKSQGLTINNSIFYNKTSLNKNLIYVALSRHRNNCIIANEKI